MKSNNYIMQDKKQPRSNSGEEGLVAEELGDFPVVPKKMALTVAEA
jgi:hypothetical protein